MPERGRWKVLVVLRDGPMTVSGTLGDWREDETRS